MPHRTIAGIGALVALLVALMATVPPAGAQSVAGTIRADRDGTPVAGAVVILVSGTGEKIRGTLSGEGGAYRLGVPAPGSYSLRVDVVGYRSVTIPAFAVGQSDSVVRDVRFTFERVTLPTNVVRASTSCERVAGETGDAARLWSEARKAIEATRLAQEERRFPVTLTRFERVLSLPDSAVQSSRSTRESGVTENPFVSLPPDSIAAVGYLARQGTREVYYGPDPRVLLSDEFVSAHCFSTRRDGRRGALGLAFRPAARPAHVEIDGVLWLDSATAELRSLEYRYVPSLGRSERGGGNIEFARLPSGTWGVTRWSIRMPILRIVESNRRPDGIASRFVDTLVIGVQEEGGEVLAGGVARVTSPGRGTRIRGMIVDSTLARPLAGAVVTLEGTGRTVRSDSTGAFAFDSLADIGTFRIRFWHARLDSLGIGMPRTAVRVRPGEEAAVNLALPGANAIARERCGRASETPVRLVTGLVRSDTPAMRGDVEVSVLEQLPSTAGSDSRIRRSFTYTDNGRFAICTLTPGSAAWIMARTGGRWTRPILLAQAALATAIDLGAAAAEAAPADTSTYLPPSQVVELARTPIGAGDMRVEGWLLFDGVPPATPAQVIVDGAVASVSSADGFFRVERIAEGTRQVAFRAPGVATATGFTTIRRGESVLLLASLSSRPAALGVVITSARRTWNKGFDERRIRGQGFFLDRADIDKRAPHTLADLLRGVPGVRVTPSGTGYRYQASASNALSIQSSTPAKSAYTSPGGAQVTLNAEERGCDLMVFVDGVPFVGDEGALDQQINVRDVAAIEVYPTSSSVPREFAGSRAACGVLVIWRT